MKKIVFALAAILTINMFGVEVSEKLLDAIAVVESKNNANAKGDYSKKEKCYRAIGAFQLWKVYVDDVNRISKKSFSYDDRKDSKKSREIVKLYLEHYGRAYERKTGKTASDEILARIHNGGPKGYSKDSTKKYWEKIKKELK